MNHKLPTRFVIVGGGLNGAAAAYQLSELVKADNAYATITLLERGEGCVPTGSSAGETRITRKASFENPHVIPGMVEISNAALLTLGVVKPVPTILVGNNPRYLDNAVAAAVASNARFSRLTEVSRRHLSYLNMDGFEGVIEDAMGEDGNGAGTLNPALAIEKMLARAEENGVIVRFQTDVATISEDSRGKIRIGIVNGESIEADKIISAAGVWSDRLVGTASTASLHTKPKVLKVFWFKLDEASQPASFPNILFKLKGGEEFARLHPDFATRYPGYDLSDPSTEEGIYMIQEELSDGTYLKFGHIQPVPKLKENPDVIVAREKIAKDHERFMAHFVREFMPGVAARLPDVAFGQASFTKTYLEGFSNDFMPIIGPRHARSSVVVMAGFSGIGAKFAVASGRYAALYALGKPEQIPENARRLFAPDRAGLRPKAPAAWLINGNLGAPGPDGTVQSPPCLDIGSLGEKAAKLYRNGYPANPGLPEARRAVANMFNKFVDSRRTVSQSIEFSNVLIATGGATDAAQIAIDHAKSKFSHNSVPVAVLITPVYHLYVGQLMQNDFDIRYVDGVDKYNDEDGSISPQTDDEILARINACITPDTCLLFVNSPRNPDGKIYRLDLLHGILKLLDNHPQLRIISDTIYKEVAPHKQNVLTLFGMASSAQRARIYETDGTSKSVAKTMDRAAWIISDAKNIEEIAAVSHLKRGRPALPQMLQIVSMDEYLAASAPVYCEKNSEMYLGKLQYVSAAASQVAGLHSSAHGGSYYGYLDFRAVDFGQPMTALEKENALVDALTVKGVAVSPGKNFKHAGAIRFNSSFNNQTLQLLMNIIIDTFSELGASVTRRDIPLPMVDKPTYNFQEYPVGVLTTHGSDRVG